MYVNQSSCHIVDTIINSTPKQGKIFFVALKIKKSEKVSQMLKLIYKRWYTRLIFRHPPPRKGIARVSQVSNFLV